MHAGTFVDLDRHLALVPARTASLLGTVDFGRGRQDAFRRQAPGVLETLVQVARIQSVDASNAIENITAPPNRLAALVDVATTPANRSEEEIVGYRKVLDTIHASAPDIPFKESVVRQFHRDLYSFTSQPGGDYKSAANDVVEYHPDGREVVRFRPVSPFETRIAMESLHAAFDGARRDGVHHPLLLVAAYVFDFLMIHPFQDGNGRLSRLISLLLLYQAGYEVGRFISLEKLIDDSRATYYERLAASTEGWHDGAHDVWPWTNYFLGLLTAAYSRFESRVGELGARGAKAMLVKQFIRSAVDDTFTVDEIRKAAPGVSDVYIRKLLSELRSKGYVRAIGRGRGARWERLRDDL
jgi:Fic family protein